jgi:G:T-mismatch repair DNA endonuclease (very short patch repair protein)
MTSHRHGGRRRELTIGRYPDISLADARGLATIKRAEIIRNVQRDAEVRRALKRLGWRVFVVELRPFIEKEAVHV